MSKNSLGTKKNLTVAGKDYEIFDISQVDGAKSLPFSLKVLLENLLRTEDGANITSDHIKALAQWDPSVEPDTEIQFTPARVVMQDFTGVPCVVDLATMREAIVDLGGDPAKVNPLAPAELVIDHSVIADVFGTKDSFEQNTDIEYERNRERYRFLRWGQGAFDEFKVVPPGTGIVHQVNIEYLARVVMTRNVDGVLRAYPDTVVGTDSHTTMVNGLGVLGWGVGGIEGVQRTNMAEHRVRFHVEEAGVDSAELLHITSSPTLWHHSDMALSPGNKIPDVQIHVLSDDGMPTPVSSAEVLGKGKVVLFAVPGAFTPGCSKVHLPGFVQRFNELKSKGVQSVACISVNDPWVMEAWKQSQGASDILMLADGVEARARAERPQDDGAFRNIVQAVIERSRREHQFDSAPLTELDLNTITDSFVNTLRTTYHPRLEYPRDQPAAKSSTRCQDSH